MKKINRLLFLSCIAGCIFLTSCDKEYDLSKDINTTINVGKNLQVPVGQTVQIPLNRIIEEGEDISTNHEGTYELHTEGSFDSHITDVDPFSINGLNPQFTDFVIDNLPMVNIPIEQEMPVTIESKATYEIAETKTELPSEVEALFFAEFNNGNGAISHITISVPSTDNGTNGITEISMNDVHIKFPMIFTLQDGTHELNRTNITLNPANNFSVDIPINIHDLQISEEEQSKYIIDANGKKYFYLHEKISFEAKTTIKLIPSQIQNTKMHFAFGYSIEPASITRVNGIVSPEVSINETLSLNDIPDFIKDKESSFTPNDITFEFTLTNPIGMELGTTINITPWDNSTNSAIGNTISIPLLGDNALKSEATTKYVISNKPYAVEYGTINIVNENLPELLATIPDSYKISTDKITADGTGHNGLELGNSYNLVGNYKVNVPFSFSQLSIKYTDEVTDLHSDLNDIADLTNKIIVECDAVTTIPVDLEASVELYDSYGNILNEISVSGQEANKVFINASQNGEESTTHITLTIEEKSGSNQLEQLDILKYNIKAKNPVNKDIVLKSSQYIVLKNGIAKLPDGITTEL